MFETREEEWAYVEKHEKMADELNRRLSHLGFDVRAIDTSHDSDFTESACIAFEDAFGYPDGLTWMIFDQYTNKWRIEDIDMCWWAAPTEEEYEKVRKILLSTFGEITGLYTMDEWREQHDPYWTGEEG